MDKKKKVWQKAKPIRGENPDVWRLDVNGHLIRNGAYGSRGSYGWEIDHVKPISKGGTHDVRNLQPLHWETNRKKLDFYPCKKR